MGDHAIDAFIRRQRRPRPAAVRRGGPHDDRAPTMNELVRSAAGREPPPSTAEDIQRETAEMRREGEELARETKALLEKSVRKEERS